MDSLLSELIAPSAECRSYATQLCSMSMQQVQLEPIVLDRAEKQLASRTQDLLCTHYGAVISSACITEQVRHQLSKVDLHLNQVEGQLPKFSDKLNKFADEAKNISKR